MLLIIIYATPLLPLTWLSTVEADMSGCKLAMAWEVEEEEEEEEDVRDVLCRMGSPSLGGPCSSVCTQHFCGRNMEM